MANATPYGYRERPSPTEGNPPAALDSLHFSSKTILLSFFGLAENKKLMNSIRSSDAFYRTLSSQEAFFSLDSIISLPNVYAPTIFKC
ncbi:MAG: hypothetical protein KME46_02610 [Brasilonema angustatum HA4187-MV1]|jgi:hypothetical protein|nr:hypothetical protein [Brasilonema angustatum HA4187-MV1]